METEENILSPSDTGADTPLPDEKTRRELRKLLRRRFTEQMEGQLIYMERARITVDRLRKAEADGVFAGVPSMAAEADALLVVLERNLEAVKARLIDPWRHYEWLGIADPDETAATDG